MVSDRSEGSEEPLSISESFKELQAKTEAKIKVSQEMQDGSYHFAFSLQTKRKNLGRVNGRADHVRYLSVLIQSLSAGRASALSKRVGMIHAATMIHPSRQAYVEEQSEVSPSISPFPGAYQC